MHDMPILQRRRIEALLMKHVYQIVLERSGADEARAVVGQAVSSAAIEHGKTCASALDHSPDLDDFATILLLWTKDNALEIDVIESRSGRFDFNVTRCRYAEMYKEMGLGDIGDLLSCSRDGDFCIGYSPDMELVRTQTIMKGASHCDFRSRMNPKSK